MRPRAWAVILALCAIMFICRVQLSGGGNNAHAQAKKQPAPASTKPSAPSPSAVKDTGEVVKYGKTADAARQLALEDARAWVAEYVAKQNPPLEWRPDADYVQRNKMVKFSDPVTIKIGEPGHEEEFQQVTATVEVTNSIFTDMQNQDRTYHSEQRKMVSRERQTLLGKMLAGLVATLAAVAVYLRLDEATKGYYSLLLRLGSVVFVATVGAGVWLFL